jgi:DNA-binding MarR family transcriptional regulator
MATPPTVLDETVRAETLTAAASAAADDALARDEALAFVTRALAETPRRIDGIDRESMELILLLHRVTNVVVYDLESRVHRPAGWTWAAFRAVFTLWISGPLEPSRLAETSGMNRQAVSSLVKTLEADGLIARSAVAHDGRSVVLSLTPTGTRKIMQVFRDHNVREADWAGTLDADERETMIRLLRKLATAAQQDWVSHRF